MRSIRVPCSKAPPGPLGSGSGSDAPSEDDVTAREVTRNVYTHRYTDMHARIHTFAHIGTSTR